MVEVEREMLAAARRMSEREGHQVAERYLEQAQRQRATLSDEQREMVRHVVRGSGDLAVVQGAAGAGKSFALGAAREAWEAQGYRVLGAALAGKAAEGLEISAGIPARSIAAWEYAWREGRELLGKGDIFVIDEAGMVGSRQLQRVLAEAERAGAKVVLVGDTRQLQAIEAGAPMRAIAERIGQVSLDEIRRQSDDWQRKASEDLAKGNVPAALAAYERAGRIHAHGGQSAAIAGVVEGWNAARLEHPKQSHLMMAFRRKEVRALNDAARAMRQANGELGRDHQVETERGGRAFAKGDRLVFLKNDRRLGVKNGSLGVVESVRGNTMVVQLDGGSRLAFDVREYNHLDHGYAVTVHKAQGVTVDRAHVLASDLFDQHVAYVGLSRHRHQVDMHWSRDTFGDREQMVQKLSLERWKDLALDHVEVERDNRHLHATRARQERAKQVPPKSSRDKEEMVVWRREEVEQLTPAQQQHREFLVAERAVDLACEARLLAVRREEPGALEYAAAYEVAIARVAKLTAELQGGEWSRTPDRPVILPSDQGELTLAVLASDKNWRELSSKWQSFCEQHSASELVDARCGVGPGAALYERYSQARQSRFALGSELERLTLERSVSRELERT